MNELAQLLQYFHRSLGHNHTVVPPKVAEKGASVELEEGDATPALPNEPHCVILHSWASLQVRVETLPCIGRTLIAAVLMLAAFSSAIQFKLKWPKSKPIILRSRSQNANLQKPLHIVHFHCTLHTFIAHFRFQASLDFKKRGWSL